MWINRIGACWDAPIAPNYLILTISTLPTDIVTDLAEIARLAALREEENDHFRSFIEARHPGETDKHVFRLQEAVSAHIDCRQCGNCCRSLMIVVSEDELDQVAALTNETSTDFKSKYIAEGLAGKMLLNSMPCRFLADSSCTIYAHRFAGCREFPALDLPGFSQRYFTIQMHYDRCPIIFNVVEQLKKELHFFSIDNT
jgi:Fe-S-cluster containining protein